MHDLMLDPDLVNKVTKNNGLCVTLQVPTRRDPSAWKENDLSLRLAVKEALEILAGCPGSEKVKSDLSKKINALYDTIDPKQALDGIAIFASTDLSVVLRYPFPVVREVVVGSHFKFRNILYLQQYIQPYKILLLGKKSIRLFSAVGNVLLEEQNEDFPFTFNEEYEYSKPALGNSFGYTMKGFEKDKSLMKEKRISSFVQSADVLLQKNLAGTGQKVVVAGSKELLHEFKTSDPSLMVGTVVGSFTNSNIHVLAQKAWYAIKDYQDTVIGDYIDAIHELRKRNLIVSGPDDTYAVAKEGRGQFLLVERDHHYYPDVDKDVDLVDTIIVTVLEKKGEVMFTNPEALADYDHMVMKLRY